MNKYSILVNTTDSFEDCWLPFFKLFSNFWPDYKGTIYLNTEFKEYTYPGLNIVSVKNGVTLGRSRENITWSECLAGALNLIDTDIILYLQEDYFLNGFVKNELVNKYVDLIAQNDIDCLHLTDQCTSGPFVKSSFDDLWITDKNAPYRLSCQAALWKKSVLKQYVRTHENPWQYEKYGTMRAHLFDHQFYAVSRDIYKIKENEIIPYVFTGIVQGRWYEEVVPLFEKYNIKVDFIQRGFVNDPKPNFFFKRLKRKIKSIPTIIKSRFEIFRIAFFS